MKTTFIIILVSLGDFTAVACAKAIKKVERDDIEAVLALTTAGGSGSADQEALCQWLRLGGPQACPLPRRLIARVLPSPTAPRVASQNLN